MNTSERDMDTIGERDRTRLLQVGRERRLGQHRAGHRRSGVFHGIAASVAPRARTATCTACACSSRAWARSARCSPAPRGGRRRGARLRRRPAARRRVGLAPPSTRADVIGTECDVYAPCALGGSSPPRPSSELRCRVVAGAANNQLADAELADRLHERGILYAPDYVINSGGVLHGTGLELLGWDQARSTSPARPRRHPARALRRRRPLAGPRRRGARRAAPRAVRSL